MQPVKILHQTSLPEIIDYGIFSRWWIESWRAHYPDYLHKLWTPKQNRIFVEKYFPWFLKTFDEYDVEIKRSDAIRYMFLYQFGGLYADLDCIALRNLAPIFEKGNVVLFAEPREHWDGDGNKNVRFSNALMYSRPFHPFWKFVLDRLYYEIPPRGDLSALWQTGPCCLSKMYRDYNEKFGAKDIHLSFDTLLWPFEKYKLLPDVNDMIFRDDLRPKDGYTVHVCMRTWCMYQGIPEREVPLNRPAFLEKSRCNSILSFPRPRRLQNA
jgi:mannosyltransferase OCH1-like enzyme